LGHVYRDLEAEEEGTSEVVSFALSAASPRPSSYGLRLAEVPKATV